MTMRRTTLALIIILSIFGILTKSVYAGEEFDTEYLVTYDVSNTGETLITQDITITNKKNSIFATSYSLVIKQMHIFDVKGSDSDGPLEIDVIETDTETQLDVKFNDQIVGEGRKYNWQLQYKSNEISSQVGEVWNAHIPKVDMIDTVKSYDVVLKVPKNFGPELFISPMAQSKEENTNYVSYKYNKDTLGNTGITASFGKYQILNYKLNYRLRNDSSLTAYQEVALPTDIAGRQQIFIRKLEPRPEKIKLDEDGNLLTTYKLSPRQEIEIELIGSVRISGKQIQPEFGGNIKKIPSDLALKYTVSTDYWEVDSKPIKELSNTLYDSSKTVSENAYNVYNYITNNFEYDFEVINKEFVERKGALKTLTDDSPSACMEFTDLFIAVTRAMGIPARELDGFAYTVETNKKPLSINLKGGDLLHAWPEYYDPNFGWVPIDPTWGTTSGIDYFTKLDTNHFAFVVKGVDSEYPYPAGTYKIDGNEKQVEVDFAIDIDESIFEGHLTKYAKDNLLNKLFNKFGFTKVNAYNDGGTILYDFNGTDSPLLPFDSKIIYLKQNQKVSYRDFNEIEVIPPYENVIGNPPVENKNNRSVFLIVVFSGLALCTIFYLLVIHSRGPKKVFRHLRRRLQGLNR